MNNECFNYQLIGAFETNTSKVIVE